MSLETLNRVWNRIEPILPWSLAPNVSPLEAIHARLSACLSGDGRLTARLYLLVGALFIVGAIEPSIASIIEKQNDWAANSSITFTKLLFCFSIYACEWYTQRTAVPVLGRMGHSPDTLTVEPSVKQIEFSAFIVGFVIVFALMGNVLTGHLTGGKASSDRSFIVRTAFDLIVWVGFVLPTGARWLGIVWTISLNATAVTSNYCITSGDYVIEKLRNAGLLRGWFDRQIGLLSLFLLCALPKVYLERKIYSSEGVLWLLAITLLGLLATPSLAVYYFVERYRSRAIKALADRLSTTRGTENDRMDYFALRTIKEPFSVWLLVASAGAAILRVYSEREKSPMIPAVSDYFHGLLSGILENPIGTLCVLAFGAVMILLYLRQVGIDLKSFKS